MCKVPLQLNGDVLVAYLIAYSSVEETLPKWSADGTAHGDYVFNICMDTEGFQVVPYILAYKDQQMIVIVEEKQPLCWSCKQLGYLVRYCPQKTSTNNSNNNNNNNDNINDNNKNKTTSIKPTLEPGDHPNNPKERWTQVTRRKKAQKQKTYKTIEPTVESVIEATTKETPKNNSQEGSSNTNNNWIINGQTTSVTGKKKTVAGEQPKR